MWAKQTGKGRGLRLCRPGSSSNVVVRCFLLLNRVFDESVFPACCDPPHLRLLSSSSSITDTFLLLLSRLQRPHTPLLVAKASAFGKRVARFGMATNHAAVLKVALGLMGLCIAGYILGPPLYWHFKEGLAAALSHSSSSSSTCAPCTCDCNSQPLLSIPPELINASFSDCAKHDPEVSEDAEKNFAELLSEELKLRETEALENQRRADMALLEAKKLTSVYQKEADKCNSGMETCEEAREKAEAALAAQKKLTAMWELRAHQRGWKEGVTKSHTQSQGNVQSV